ncbi:MAG: hypothetical protein RI908_1074 [Actinomycetota bacterium]
MSLAYAALVLADAAVSDDRKSTILHGESTVGDDDADRAMHAEYRHRGGKCRRRRASYVITRSNHPPVHISHPAACNRPRLTAVDPNEAPKD